jgi:hypothetical protein
MKYRVLWSPEAELSLEQIIDNESRSKILLREPLVQSINISSWARMTSGNRDLKTLTSVSSGH